LSYLNIVELLKIPIIYAIIVGVVIGVITELVLAILKKLLSKDFEWNVSININPRKIAFIASAFFIIIGLIYVLGPYKDQTISEVPNLTGLSKDMAASKLDEVGLRLDFKEKFNCTIEKNYIIPGTQDPKAGTYVQKNSLVKASISMGPIPNVIGQAEEEAKLALRESKLNLIVKDGRNASVDENYVYDQYPKGCGAFVPGSNVTIYVNRHVNVYITSPLDKEEVLSPVALEGNLSVPLLADEYLWIVVNPREALMNYYPQSGGPLIPTEELTFTGNAYLGTGSESDIGKKYNLQVLLLNYSLNEVFKKYMINGHKTGNWSSITDQALPSDITVSREAIVKSIKRSASDVSLKGYLP
jgi:hypothetical protein